MPPLWIGRGCEDECVTLEITTDADVVARLAGAQAALDPVGYTVFGTIAHFVLQPDAAPWAAHPVGSPSILAARSSLTSSVGFSAGWSAVEEVAAAIAEMQPATAGIGGPPETVAAVVAALGRPVTKRMDERLFRLDELHAPSNVNGTPRVADESDLEWLVHWFTDFATEAFGRLPPGFDAQQMAQRGVHRATCWIWTDANGVASSMAVARPPVNGVSRIGPVYTPRDFRGRGYGSAITAAASRAVLEAGDVACLYTDLANPTSNKIYRQLGYRAVLDRTNVLLD
jgi:predicted GNAT family acetyltransferase